MDIAHDYVAFQLSYNQDVRRTHMTLSRRPRTTGPATVGARTVTASSSTTESPAKAGRPGALRVEPPVARTRSAVTRWRFSPVDGRPQQQRSDGPAI